MGKTEIILLVGTIVVVLIIMYLFYYWITDKDQDKGPFDKRIPPGS